MVLERRSRKQDPTNSFWLSTAISKTLSLSRQQLVALRRDRTVDEANFIALKKSQRITKRHAEIDYQKRRSLWAHNLFKGGDGNMDVEGGSLVNAG